MTIYFKKIYKNVTREKSPSCPIDYRDVHNQWKKIEKLGLGTLKNCMIYRRSDTHKIWTIVIWNGFVIIRLLQQRGGGWWTPVFSSKFDECTLLILVRPPEWTQGPWSRVQSISSGTNSCLPMVTTCAIGPICTLNEFA